MTTRTNAYHYTECGLENVWIHNLAVCTDDFGEEVYTIPNALSLHAEISAIIVFSDRRLTGIELRFLRTELGLTQQELAKMVSKKKLAISRWERDEVALDPNAETVIRMLVIDHLGRLDRIEDIKSLIERHDQHEARFYIDIDGSDPNRYRPLEAA